MKPKECIFPQQWQKFETREEAEKFIRFELMQEKMRKKFLELKADFEARNSKEMGGMFFRWADEDVYWWGKSVEKEILADVMAYFNAKEIVDRIEDPFSEYVGQYLLQEKKNALKLWRKHFREMGKSPTKKQTQQKIADFDAWAKEVFPACVEKVKLRYAKAKGMDELEKIELKKNLIASLEKIEEENLNLAKKKAVIDLLYLRYDLRLRRINEKYSAESLCLPKFETKAKEIDLANEK